MLELLEDSSPPNPCSRCDRVSLCTMYYEVQKNNSGLLRAKILYVPGRWREPGPPPATWAEPHRAPGLSPEGGYLSSTIVGWPPTISSKDAGLVEISGLALSK